jgi:anti-sigma B factor antagonist
MKPACLILNMSGVPYMDSAGLGLLTNYFVAAQGEGRKFLLACVNERILSLLEMTKVDQILKMYPSVEAAQEA